MYGLAHQTPKPPALQTTLRYSDTFEHNYDQVHGNIEAKMEPARVQHYELRTAAAAQEKARTQRNYHIYDTETMDDDTAKYDTTAVCRGIEALSSTNKKITN